MGTILLKTRQRGEGSWSCNLSHAKLAQSQLPEYQKSSGKVAEAVAGLCQARRRGRSEQRCWRAEFEEAALSRTRDVGNASARSRSSALAAAHRGGSDIAMVSPIIITGHAWAGLFAQRIYSESTAGLVARDCRFPGHDEVPEYSRLQ